MEKTPDGSMSKSESGKRDYRRSTSTSAGKYQTEDAPDRDYQHSNSTSESEDTLLQDGVTSLECLDNLPSKKSKSAVETPKAITAEYKELHMKNEAEIQNMHEKLRATIAESGEVNLWQIVEFKDCCSKLINDAYKWQLAEIHALSTHLLERMRGGEEISQEDFVYCLERIVELSNIAVS